MLCSVVRSFVQFNLKNFDLAFVFKDYSKLPSRVDAIPVQYLEQLKAWLSREEILYHETPINILWKNILRDIQKDVEGFWSDGGWMSLLGQQSDDEGCVRQSHLTITPCP